MAEGVGRLLTALSDNPYSGVKFYYSAPIHAPHPTLHYANSVNLDATARIEQHGRVLYQAHYTTDQFGRRTSIVDAPEKRDKFALFFGDSFTWGYFVDDQQTFPSQIGRLAQGYMPYNYGQNSAGPQQMLAKFRSKSLRAEIPQAEGVLIYTYIEAQARRAIGSMRVTNARGRSMGFYTVDKNGELSHSGNMISGRPLVSRLYRLLGKSQLLSYLGLDIPHKLSSNDIGLVVRMLVESKNSFKQQFGSDSFYVVIYPTHGEAELRRQLDAAGIVYLDYSNWFDRKTIEYWMPDGHPTAVAYSKVAKRLAKDLSLE